MKRVLILGGTREASKLIARASKIDGLETIASLAGRTRKPQLSSTTTRTGGFGGISGLTDYLQEQHIDLLVDATHPFAAEISFNAAIAAATVGIPYLILIRPPWEKTDGDRWIEVESNQEAAEVLSQLGHRRIFLTIGRQELAAYSRLQQFWFLMRAIDPPPPNIPLPPGKLLTERGPFSLDQERSLLQKYQIEVIVSKNSGGDATYAKIIAARELGIPVVIIKRPSLPQGERVGDEESAIFWLQNHI
jgi:precorrin-6A/cobalt-precorrin-6A reductase